ncbi:MAG: hypothetical protein AB1758_27400 [Candidatus Eremiobacterota bacterium]
MIPWLEKVRGQAASPDGLLFLGAVDDARQRYLTQEGPVSSSDAAVCDAVLERHQEAQETWRELLASAARSDLNLLPVRYNLALDLFVTRRYLESQAEFKRCRNPYPHYRDTLFWLERIRLILTSGGDDCDPLAAARLWG